MDNLLKNWDFMRVLRSALGIYILVQGVQDRVWLFIVLGGLFSLTAILNIGCCATGNCTVDTPLKTDKPEDVKFEEIR